MKKEMPKVSVIIPVYNAEKYIEQLLQSILEQTYKNIEIIIVENLSEDDSFSLCKKWEKKDARIRVVQEKQKGAGPARKRGLREVSGTYILFADADDYFSDLTVIEAMVKVLEQSVADIAVCNYARLWKGQVLSAVSHAEFATLHRDTQDFRFRGFFSAGNLSYVWGKLYRRSFLAAHDLSFTDCAYGEDKLFNLKCYVCGACYGFVDIQGYMYRKNEESVMHQVPFQFSECWLTIAAELDHWLQEQEADVTCYDLVAYLIFFGSFFDAKSGYLTKRKNVFSIWRILRFYGKNELARRCFTDMSKGKYQKGLTQRFWKMILRGFSGGMRCHMYLLMAYGILFLIRHRVDERLSDTGLRDEP